ncbi:MAG: hypothetical protein ACP5N3_03230 [Candidatus Nanoarchaeia archaeon]
MSETTIKIHDETKMELDKIREYKNESYDEVIKKMLFIVKNVKKNPELSAEAVESIERARARLKQGLSVNEKSARKRLGL